MILFKKYSSIKDFLYRFTILKIGKLHIRIHTIKSEDKTELYHNHPFHYLSIILKGGYTDKYIVNNEIKTKEYKRFNFIFRSKDIFHRIDSLKSETITLFIAYGNYDWKALNVNKNTIPIQNNGIYQRNINGKNKWCKYENGIWFIGNENKLIAEKEIRHSIHQA